MEGEQQKIRVVIRKRPLNKKEINKNQQDIVEVSNGVEAKVREHKLKVDLTKYIEEHLFTFDSAFGEQVNNQGLYQQCIRPIISSAFQGAKVTCFAYGQTGSGKTYTMNGDLDNGCPGIYYLGAKDIFTLRNQSYSNLSISVSFFQIYCGKLFDLLNNREILQAREDGKQNVNIVGLTVKPISSSQQFMETIAYGSSVRITSQNSTNTDSSRSHAILQISLLNGRKTYGKISFIDLAGCERGADTIDQNKQTKIDGAEINKSLLALKECIRALDQGKTHTPFRGSKLTMVLKDSFTGFCRTVMIGNVSPGSGSCQNTLNTLRYADRVKQLKKGNQIAQLSKQQQLARQLMLPRNQNRKQIIVKNDSNSEEQIIIVKHDKKQKYSNLQKHMNKSDVKNITNSRKGAMSVMPTKKLKYLNQNSIEEDQTPHTKKMIGSTVSTKQIKGRNGIMQAHNQNSRVDQKSNLRGQRNKSVTPVHKGEIKNKLGNKFTQAITTERDYFKQNFSALNLVGNRENNTYKNNGESNQCREISSQDIQKSDNMNFKKIKSQQSDQFQDMEAQLNDNWEIILNKFRMWTPNTEEFEKMSEYFQELVKFIMKQEVELFQFHKQLLLKEEPMLSQSLHLHNEVHRQSKNNQQMMSYTQRLSSHFMTRARLFTQFNRKVQLYRYHLREHEICQSKLVEVGSHIKSNEENNYFHGENDSDIPLWAE